MRMPHERAHGATIRQMSVCLTTIGIDEASQGVQCIGQDGRTVTGVLELKSEKTELFFAPVEPPARVGENVWHWL